MKQNRKFKAGFHFGVCPDVLISSAKMETVVFTLPGQAKSLKTESMRKQENDFFTEFFNVNKSSTRDLINPDCKTSETQFSVQTFENNHFRKQNPEKFKNPYDSIMQQEFQWDVDENNKSANLMRVVKPELETKQAVKIIPLNSGYKANLSGCKGSQSQTQKMGMRNFESENLKTPGTGRCGLKRNMST